MTLLTCRVSTELETKRIDLAVPAFRFIANLEALSWAGLLLGMLFKYLIASQHELGLTLVAIFGRVHGALVVIYFLLALRTAARLRWRFSTSLLAVAATVPPFATVAFDWWAHRTGKYEPAGSGRAQLSGE